MYGSPPKDVDWNNLDSVKAYYERLQLKQNDSVSTLGVGINLDSNLIFKQCSLPKFVSLHRWSRFRDGGGCTARQEMAVVLDKDWWMQRSAE